jgi:hypothetical protein
MMPSFHNPNRLILHLALLACLSTQAFGASFRSRNFIVTADTRDLAREIGEHAEHCRKQFALDWFGFELPPWDDPCLVSAAVGDRLAVRGRTTYEFDQRRPTRWEMQVQGPRQVLLRSVVPHEIMHAIFATHFGRRLPWWAEEGACVSVEHRQDRGDLEKLLPNHLDSGQVMILEQTFALGQYPENSLSSYAQGYSLVSFLLKHGGKRKFIAFLGDGVDGTDWASAAQIHYGHATLGDLLDAWLQSAAPSAPASNTLAADVSNQLAP